ncbi:hypothetical protein LSH36_193g02063 [Paralvinella palmiformis]|uniref:Uncharacterized protein n=1 Tax=Paralvinella palmiformis TaxID=53620 RepID=A0AAD9JSD4_9ANNE|nr:hypothetical protein LSH36_193g02063 [Paralvinella palmiformis]
MELWHPSIKRLFTVPKPLHCRQSGKNWVYVKNGTFMISEEAIKKYGNVTCEYGPFARIDDNSENSWCSNEFLAGVVLEGYNIVGDGTTQALLPILTGHTDLELPEARRGFPGAKPVDGFPWIWKDFADAGYVTQWGEDAAGIGTFTYRMLGFKEQPVDHYYRHYQRLAEAKYYENTFDSASNPNRVWIL